MDYIKYMRNWASAAHPNQTEITGLQLISWLETCIKEVINLPNSNITIETGRFLKNLKEKPFSSEEISEYLYSGKLKQYHIERRVGAACKIVKFNMGE